MPSNGMVWLLLFRFLKQSYLKEIFLPKFYTQKEKLTFQFFCPIHVLYHWFLLNVLFLIGNYQYPFQNITTPASWPCNAIRMENGFCRFAYFPDTFSIIPTAPPHNLSTLPSGRVRVFIQEDCKYYFSLSSKQLA